MHVETLRNYCLSKKGVTESFPFDEVSLVFKVMDKMFALIPLEKELQISLKCDPEIAIELRERYACVEPAYHFNKKHWNAIFIYGSIDDKLVFEWVDHSYDLVVAKLTRNQQKELNNL